MAIKDNTDSDYDELDKYDDASDCFADLSSSSKKEFSSNS
jgi:hypothetical protein